ncbi:hypothetical protein [Pantoea ananatis]|uniref:hypothetical protein n=1 Tax=Pantoea ananas TaxID=553 RepID=UPI0039B89B8D
MGRTGSTPAATCRRWTWPLPGRAAGGASLGSARYSLRFQASNAQRPATLLVERRHMGEETTYVVPMAVFERASCGRCVRSRGLVREGAQIVRGNKTQAITSFAQAYAWLFEEAKKGRQIQRFKGLGEMNAEQLWETTVNPIRVACCSARTRSPPIAWHRWWRSGSASRARWRNC